MKPIGINFHEGLQLSRPRLAVTLRFLSENRGATKEQLRDGTELGANMVVAFPNLGIGCGFVEEGETRGMRRLTRLGERVVASDPYLDELTSQWLIHVGLVDPAGRGPAYWKNLMLDIIRPGNRYTSAQLVMFAQENETVVREKVNVAVGKLTEGYTNDAFLGPLGLLEKGNGGLYASFPKAVPPTSVFALTTALRWSDILQEQLTTSLDTFLQQSRLPDIFHLSSEQCIKLLEDCQTLGFVELYRTATPHQIVRKWKSVSEVIDSLY